MLDVGVHPVEPVCPGDVPHVDLCSSNSKPSASIPYLRWSTMCSYSHFLLTHHPLHPVVGGPDVLHQGGLVVSPLLGQTKQREVIALISQKFMKVLILSFSEFINPFVTVYTTVCNTAEFVSDRNCQEKVHITIWNPFKEIP